jgi:hypothetical protein
MDSDDKYNRDEAYDDGGNMLYLIVTPFPQKKRKEVLYAFD